MVVDVINSTCNDPQNEDGALRFSGHPSDFRMNNHYFS